MNIIISPTIIPKMITNPGAFERYINNPCGIISPKTTYNIAPLAKDKDSDNNNGPISPIK